MSYPGDGSSFFRYWCGEPMTGKYVTVQRMSADSEALTVGEIEVYVDSGRHLNGEEQE